MLSYLTLQTLNPVFHSVPPSIPSLTFEPGSGILGTFFHVKSRAPVEGCDATALFRLAKRGTARDEANSCPLQKNRHFLTLASFLAGQLKTIPEMRDPSGANEESADRTGERLLTLFTSRWKQTKGLR